MTEEHLEPELVRGLNLSAIMLTSLGSRAYSSLFGFDHTNEVVQKHLRNFLASKGIGNKKQAKDVLYAYLHDKKNNSRYQSMRKKIQLMDSKSFDEWMFEERDATESRQLQLVWENRWNKGAESIRAYDISLYLLLARMSGACDYISAQEVSNRVYDILPEALSLFNTWEDFSNNVLLGHAFNFPERKINYLSGESADSMWKAWHEIIQADFQTLQPFKG